MELANISTTTNAETLVRREACPVCRSNGKDRSGDNLAVYKDGHTYCYSCGHFQPAPPLEALKTLSTKTPEVISDLNFPNDYSKYFPGDVIRWLRKYGINDFEIKRYNMGWSESLKRLIFPIWENNKMVMWQGRYFGGDPKAPKYLTKGQKKDTLVVCDTHSKHTNIAIVVEDLISAIKVGRIYSAVPLWGCVLHSGLLRKLQDQFDILGIWLDPDKTTESVKQAIWASQFLPTFVVTSKQDPKDYSPAEIVEFIDICSREMLTGLEGEEK